MPRPERNLRAIGRRRAVEIGRFAIAVIELAEHLEQQTTKKGEPKSDRPGPTDETPDQEAA